MGVMDVRITRLEFDFRLGIANVSFFNFYF